MFLFIIVFDVIYMLLPLYVLCSKIAIKKILFILKSREIQRDFPCSRDSGWISVGVLCAVFVTSRHTTHYRSKTVKSRIFLSSCL